MEATASKEGLLASSSAVYSSKSLDCSRGPNQVWGVFVRLHLNNKAVAASELLVSDVNETIKLWPTWCDSRVRNLTVGLKVMPDVVAHVRRGELKLPQVSINVDGEFVGGDDVGTAKCECGHQGGLSKHYTASQE